MPFLSTKNKVSTPKKVRKSFFSSILKTTHRFFGSPNENQLHCRRRINHQEVKIIREVAVEVTNNNIVDDDDDDEGRNCKALVLHGVDAKAQEYIDSVRRTWMIEKQNSDKEFCDMLARGT
ncbi:hypothetical protein HS088_TW21G00080 [Tripterygium wilfordii]|uniref:Uncharacterized protein n=1 Tax=Tripterygium wilfordii TaxID=458696 RepID=A0A7J7C1A9_TRIWF|nr:hypothetical protein HS088_TW21G00080 [Tripterygium wilfordii]